MSDRKIFSKADYIESDPISKKVVSDFFESRKFFNIPPVTEDELYKDGDFIMFDKETNKKYIVEVERKLVWKKIAEWEGWDTVHVPKRKEKNLSKFYVMVNYHFNTIALTTMKRITSSPVIKKDTIYTTDEEFFEIPITEFKIYFRSLNGWVEIKNI